jgi:glucokinase
MDVALGIDIGATKFAVGIVSRNGGLLDREVTRINRRATADELYDDLAQLVASQLSKAVDTYEATPVVVGVGSAGPIAPNVEWVSPLNIAAWRQFPLRECGPCGACGGGTKWTSLCLRGQRMSGSRSVGPLD